MPHSAIKPQLPLPDTWGMVRITPITLVQILHGEWWEEADRRKAAQGQKGSREGRGRPCEGPRLYCLGVVRMLVGTSLPRDRNQTGRDFAVATGGFPVCSRAGLCGDPGRCLCLSGFSFFLSSHPHLAASLTSTSLLALGSLWPPQPHFSRAPHLYFPAGFHSKALTGHGSLLIPEPIRQVGGVLDWPTEPASSCVGVWKPRWGGFGRKVPRGQAVGQHNLSPCRESWGF